MMRTLAITTLVFGTIFAGSVATAQDASASVSNNAGMGGALAPMPVFASASSLSTEGMSATFLA